MGAQAFYRSDVFGVLAIVYVQASVCSQGGEEPYNRRRPATVGNGKEKKKQGEVRVPGCDKVGQIHRINIHTAKNQYR